MGRSKSCHRQGIANVQQAQQERQRQGTEQVTKSQSLTLVKNLIRVSISTVCHLRNIFPASCFQERSYAGMRIYQLDAASRDSSTDETVVRNEQAYMLTKWLESGVFEAVERRYLRRMEFLIVSPELNLPRESYSFDLDYPEDEDDHEVTFSGTKLTTVGSARGQLVKLIRSLIQFSNTLEEVPNERIINMKLWYFDERTPPDWEPQYFEAADPSDLCFKREADHDNLHIRIGELRTPHHTLKVHFKGIDTTLDGDRKTEVEPTDKQSSVPDDEGAESNGGDGGASRDDPRITRRSQQGSLLKCEAGPVEDEEDVGGERTAGRDVSRSLSGMMTHLDVSTNEHSEDEVDEVDEGTDESAMKAARDWVLAQARPTIA